MSILLDMFETRAGKLIVPPNHGWLITRYISASETTFLPQKLSRVPTQASYSRCRPTSLRCSMSGMKMFLGQFFSKATCRPPPPPASALSTLLGISAQRSPDHKALPSSTSSIREPRIKIKIVQNIYELQSITRTHHTKLPCFEKRTWGVRGMAFGLAVDQLQLNKIMSRQENTSNKSQQQQTTSTPSRLARTNPNRAANNPLPFFDPFHSGEENVKHARLPNKVSTLDKNVIFQDVDNSKQSNNQPTNSSKANNAGSVSQLQGDKTMGLISNVFLGSTSKFVRGAVNNVAITPLKVEEIEQTPQDTSKGTPVKFSRSKEIEQKARTISMKEPPLEQGQATDRSNAQTGRKIQRKQGTGRELKFTADKKEEKVESTPDKSAPSAVLSARKTEKFKLEPVKTEEKVEQPPQEQFVPRVYQPIQRQNPYARSRIVSEQPVVEKEKQAVIQKPKEQVAKPMNRLVQSRLQSQILSQSKVSEQKEVKPLPTSTINRTSESRLVTEVTPQVVPPKEQIKPKPYSRSFITRKPEAESKIQSTQSTILQPTVKQTQTKPMQQSKIVEDKSKSQIKQNAPEASDAKIVLKKTACIALVGKRLVRSRLFDGFTILKNHKQAEKVKKVNQCQIIYFSMNSITKLKENNLIKLAFENIKKKFTASYVTSLKSYADQLPSNHRNAGLQLIDRIFCAKMRQNFKNLKTLLQRAKNRSRCVTTLQSFHKRKVTTIVKNAFESIKLKQKNLLNYLNQLSVIFSQVNKNKLVSAFARIAAVKPVFKKIQASPVKQAQRSRATSKVEEPTTVIEDTSNQALIEKVEKLRKALTVSQGEISGIEASLAKKKKGVQLQKGSMGERVTVLKHQNEQIYNQIEIKKHRSAQIKKEMEIIPTKKNELEEELSIDRSSKLQLLTNIYISNFKNAEERVSANELLENYRIHIEDKSSLLFNEWNCILRNVQLKRVIAAYEGVDPRQNKGRANLVSQQGLISRLIRSYVKEQYFWQWIHLSAMT